MGLGNLTRRGRARVWGRAASQLQVRWAAGEEVGQEGLSIEGVAEGLEVSVENWQGIIRASQSSSLHLSTGLLRLDGLGGGTWGQGDMLCSYSGFIHVDILRRYSPRPAPAPGLILPTMPRHWESRRL